MINNCGTCVDGSLRVEAEFDDITVFHDIVLAFNTSLTERVGQVLNGYGVQIIQSQLTEFAPCRAIAINGHAAIGQYTLWTGF